MRKLRPKEVQKFAQSHTAKKQSQDLNTGLCSVACGFPPACEKWLLGSSILLSIDSNCLAGEECPRPEQTFPWDSSNQGCSRVDPGCPGHCPQDLKV